MMEQWSYIYVIQDGKFAFGEHLKTDCANKTHSTQDTGSLNLNVCVHQHNIRCILSVK